ncbi:MAG TPA: BON domain-containing protein [Stellaceae bacterium]|jgi:osmotically-inducible protein OsmY|nr:BON domain-containing protein [Stellaceae bacterium]
MTRFSFTIAILSTALLSPLLGGCAVAVVGGVAAAGGAGYQAAQERGVNGTFDDMHMQAQISNALNGQYGMVSTTVYGGQILLTGSSPSPQAKFQAEQVARQAAPSARALYNEIQVGPNADGMQIAKDDWITARVRSDLVFSADVRSGNYTIETDRGSVYLLGSARSQAELDKATQTARYVPGVQRVVSYIQVRYGEPNGQPPATAQAGPPPMGYGTNQSYVPPSGPPSANAPIQVQKLN